MYKSQKSLTNDTCETLTRSSSSAGLGTGTFFTADLPCHCVNLATLIGSCAGRGVWGAFVATHTLLNDESLHRLGDLSRHGVLISVVVVSDKVDVSSTTDAPASPLIYARLVGSLIKKSGG